MAARCHVQRKPGGWASDRAQERAETKRLARLATALGKDDAVALCTAGDALLDVAGDLEAGAALTERALALNPNLAWAWLFSGWTSAALGEPDIALDGEVCGDIALRASVAWSDDGYSLQLTSPRLEEEETRRIAASTIDPTSLVTAITRAPRMAMPLHGDIIEALVTGFGSSLSDESLDVSITVSSVAPASVDVREDELIAWMRMRGEVVLRQR
jgi:hypothetical protein